nr:hypothetical protein [Burkholderia ubonensis]
MLHKLHEEKPAQFAERAFSLCGLQIRPSSAVGFRHENFKGESGFFGGSLGFVKDFVDSCRSGEVIFSGWKVIRLTFTVFDESRETFRLHGVVQPIVVVRICFVQFDSRSKSRHFISRICVPALPAHRFYRRQCTLTADGFLAPTTRMARKLTTLKPRVQTLASSRVATAVPGSWRVGKVSSTARGYGYVWQKLRADHLAKNPHCVYCLRELGMAGWSPADVILACAARGIAEPLGTIGDHIVAHRGDRRLQLDPSNVQTLCKPHHDSAKQREERGGRR